VAQAADGVVFRVGVAQRPAQRAVVAGAHADHHVAHRLPGGQHAVKGHLVTGQAFPVLAQQLPVGPRGNAGRVVPVGGPAEKAARRAVGRDHAVVRLQHHHAGAQVGHERPRVGFAHGRGLAGLVGLLPQAQRYQRVEQEGAQELGQQEGQQKDRGHMVQRAVGQHDPAGHDQDQADLEHRQTGQRAVLGRETRPPLGQQVAQSQRDQHQHTQHVAQLVQRRPARADGGGHLSQQQAGQQRAQHPRAGGAAQIDAQTDPGGRVAGKEQHRRQAGQQRAGAVHPRHQRQRGQDAQQTAQRPPARPFDGRVAAHLAPEGPGNERVDAQPHQQQGRQIRPHAATHKRSCADCTTQPHHAIGP